jgi:class 3 adenylate cyclase
MDRTWLCSVLFMDMADYSSQSTELQMKWKQRFNGYLGEAIKDVPDSERVILDTGDGAAICFLGAPEAAMFAALQLRQCFVVDERDQPPGLRVRIGINLGPVKLVKDINGALNAIGDGLNAGQRIMSFAAANTILVSQSFFEVVSRLSDDYKKLFQLKGVEADKHIREHTVYHLTPPGSDKKEPVVVNADGHATASTPEGVIRVASTAAASTEPRVPQHRSIVPWLVAGGALVALAAVGAWHFYGSSATAKQNANATSVAHDPAPVAQVSQPTPPPVAVSSPDKPATKVETPLANTPAPPIAKVAEPVPPARAASSPDKSTSPARTADAAGARVVAPVARTQVENAPPLPARASTDPAKLLQDGKNQLADNNPQAARETFRNAADAGNAQAAVLLGTLYAQGLGGPKSDSDAVRMFTRAADLGSARGMYNLGLMYEAGRVTPASPDNQAAANWYSQAANLGDHDAAYRLGLMYEQGRGVQRDLNEARRLYGKAGTPDATTRLAKLPAQ